ncbi:MAG: HupE/UreJ family protein [Thermoanaerobaculia bacterium]|nr:HupE/UreJ family protein [Thermoanaerobaculia bacterium]
MTTGRTLGLLALVAVLALAPAAAHGHPMDERNAGFVQSIDGFAPAPFVYLGAKHMATGLDHILFLIGVVFFLYRPRDVVLYVSLFTLGHSLTLLAGVLGGLEVDSHLIDAVIGLSVVYKGFENIGGFERLGGGPDSRAAVAIFGLFHGLGLATRLQELAPAREGLVGNILSFNLGVEVGQILALGAVLILLAAWRRRPSFGRFSFATNTALMTAGFLLAGSQILSYLLY